MSASSDKKPHHAAGDDDDAPPGGGDGGGTVTIWDTIVNVVEHPLLCIAIQLVRGNIESCFSRRYAIVDQPNNRAALLNLRGEFYLARLDNSYAVTVSSTGRQGIAFNEKFVQASTARAKSFEEDGKVDVEAMLQDRDIVTFVAVLQESLEHELGHTKFRNVGCDDGKAFKVLTPEKLRSEAGYAIQRQIRSDHFPNEAAENTCAIIGIDDKPNGYYCGLLKARLHWLPEKKNGRDPNKHFTKSKILSLDEIAHHMDYPTEEPGKVCQSSGRAFDDDDDDEGGSPPDDEGPRSSKRQKQPPPPLPPSSTSLVQANG